MDNELIEDVSSESEDDKGPDSLELDDKEKQRAFHGLQQLSY